MGEWGREFWRFLMMSLAALGGLLALLLAGMAGRYAFFDSSRDTSRLPAIGYAAVVAVPGALLLWGAWKLHLRSANPLLRRSRRPSEEPRPGG
jgi:hypothetical protein